MLSNLVQATQPAVGAATAATPTTTTTAQPVEKRDVPPPTPIKFPSLVPRDPSTIPPSSSTTPLRTLFRSIQRATDIKLTHLEALGLHVIPDAPLSDLLPDPTYLPPPSWSTPLPPDVDPETLPAPPLLNNSRPAPSRKIYLERVKELSTANTPAFRTVRRLPPSPGEPAARLGNAYEFFKNLELLSGFWIDTSQPASSPSSVPDTTPLHQRVNVRSGSGAQTPPEFRTALLAALVKLVAYDFSCNVSLARVEPRLHLGASTSDARSFPHTSPPTSFPTHISFIYRTPSDRASARSGIVEGPVAALSARHTTAFERPLDELLDLCREIVGVLVTAQQRAREGRDEVRRDPEDEKWWWCSRRRWGGGTGGPIGKEEAQVAAAEAVEKTASADPAAVLAGVGVVPRALPRSASGSALAAAVAAAGGGGKRRGTGRKTMSLYDNYRMVRPPSNTWDRKARYMSIGKVEGADYDDVFLVSCLNHHVSVSRCRVRAGLLDVLEGRADGMQGIGEGEAGMRLWRSRWWDLFLVEERIEAMTAIWGMMAWLMRGEAGEKVEGEGMEGVEAA